MRRRIDRRFLPPSSSTTLNAAQSVANSPIDEKLELEQVNAIYSLLENRYTRKVWLQFGYEIEKETHSLTCKQYPISGSLMKPASNPTHYTDLIKELEEAPQRSWFSTMTNKWKGFLRFQ